MATTSASGAPPTLRRIEPERDFRLSALGRSLTRPLAGAAFPPAAAGGDKMAEASAAALAPHRFFCHSCKGEVSPKLPEYTCPRCESGFIEEVTDDSRYLSPNVHRVNFRNI
nr:PREDICTED: E3 ubiquitin-protein ligase RNF115-like [Anolis carolinensis]|eukprot:XP_008123816.1 PREDICTED: E3 ubiquitin-protein ligase RNF115-like [Anolis carolinensis]